MDKQTHYLTAEQAAKELQVSLPTLYAYVSRGMIRSEEAEGNSRARRYLAEDVQRLRERKEQRREPGKAAETALNWGAPVLESAMTLIDGGRLYYRGQDAMTLAVSRSVEQVASLLWTGETEKEADLFPTEPGGRDELSPRCLSVLPHLNGLTPVEQFQALLPLAGTEDLAAYSLTPSAAQAGVRILRLLTAIACGGMRPREGIAANLQRAWLPENAAALPLLSAALILCADHELNVSAFTARCVASAGASPYMAVNAGLSALQGTRHGGHTERVEALFREADGEAEARTVLLRWRKRGESLPGFGHPLYPNGDPRGRLLLERITGLCPDAPVVRTANALAAEVADTLKEFPTIDFALVTLALALKLPPGSALTLFALGRTIGWIGHIIEQYAQDRLIRPRARYVGPPPGERKDI